MSWALPAFASADPIAAPAGRHASMFGLPESSAWRGLSLRNKRQDGRLRVMQLCIQGTLRQKGHGILQLSHLGGLVVMATGIEYGASGLFYNSLGFSAEGPRQRIGMLLSSFGNRLLLYL